MLTTSNIWLEGRLYTILTFFFNPKEISLQGMLKVEIVVTQE